jgi:hypothetical protein
MAISKVPQDNVKIVGRSPLAERARSEQILRRAKEEAPVNTAGNARGIKAANQPTSKEKMVARRGVEKPGYQFGPKKTSPVPGMSRTQAAINSLTPKGRAENTGRINAVMGDALPSRSSTLQGAGGVLGGQHAGGHSDVMGAINMGGFTVKTPVIKPTSTKNK